MAKKKKRKPSSSTWEALQHLLANPGLTWDLGVESLDYSIDYYNPFSELNRRKIEQGVNSITANKGGKQPFDEATPEYYTPGSGVEAPAHALFTHPSPVNHPVLNPKGANKPGLHPNLNQR